MQLSLKYRKPYNANTILESDFRTNSVNSKYIQFEVGNYSQPNTGFRNS